MSPGTAPRRLSVVTLGVADLDRSIAFYEALGWPRSSASVEGEVAFFKLDGAFLALFGRAALAEDAHVPDDGHGFAAVTTAINVDREDEVADVIVLAERAGATVTKPATRAFWGGVSGYFADPDGFLWEVVWNPGFPFAD